MRGVTGVIAAAAILLFLVVQTAAVLFGEFAVTAVHVEGASSDLVQVRGDELVPVDEIGRGWVLRRAAPGLLLTVLALAAQTRTVLGRRAATAPRAVRLVPLVLLLAAVVVFVLVDGFGLLTGLAGVVAVAAVAASAGVGLMSISGPKPTSIPHMR